MFRIHKFESHSCELVTMGNTPKPGKKGNFKPHALTAAALAPATQRLVDADKTVKPAVLSGELEKYVNQKPTAAFASKVKSINLQSGDGAATEVQSVGILEGYVALIEKAGNRAAVTTINATLMKEVLSRKIYVHEF